MTTGSPFSVVIGMGRSGIGAARGCGYPGASGVVEWRAGRRLKLDQIAQELRAEGSMSPFGTPLPLGSFRPVLRFTNRGGQVPRYSWDHAVLRSCGSRGFRPVCGRTFGWAWGV